MAMGYLLVDAGGGRVFPIPPGESVAGRAEDAAIHLEHSSISRHHARFGNGPEGLWIEDLGSSNGTLVQGQTPQGRVALQEGDAVCLGHAEFLIQCGLVADAPAAADPPRAKARATQRVGAPPLPSPGAPAPRPAPAPAPMRAAGGASQTIAAAAFIIGLLLGAVVLGIVVLGR
jgi:hypothetical protein